MKDAALRSMMVLGWTAVLPLVGFSIFGILTIFPLFGVILGLKLLPLIYIGGAVPAFVTAACFEFHFRHWEQKRSLAATAALGAAASVLWLAGVMYVTGERVPNLNYYATFALAVAGAFPAALMPLTRFAKDRRRFL